MDQGRIWEHFQNEGATAFAGSRPRLEHLAGRLRAGEDVLDVGVGDGALARAAAARGARVHLLDPDERTIARLRDALALGDRARAGGSQAIPWPDASFDVVVMSEVLEHLDDATLAATLREVARVLRPGGRFLGTVPADEVLADNAVVCPGCALHFHRWGHVRSFDEDALRALLGGSFRDVAVRRRWFIAWARLNWAGRAQAAAQVALSLLGRWGTGHTFMFEARNGSIVD